MSTSARVPRSPSVVPDPARSDAFKRAPQTTTEPEPTTTLGLQRFEWELLTVSTAIKLLLFPTYHSTDFEVHRNWLAITRTLPIREWYFEATSQWTLDYPPFFAYFSWILAQPAVLVDPLIVSLHEGLEYAALSCKYYMRTTVVVTELVFAAALLAHARLGSQRTVKIGYADHVRVAGGGVSTSQLLSASLLMHPGLIIIDHIHFQYNGFLFGILAWSLWAARQDKPLLCAFLFSSLLNLKHIYVYVAPAYLVYLLRTYVLPVGSTASDLARAFKRLLTVAVVTLIPFLLSLAPLAIDGLRHQAGAIGVLTQMLQRLFPFGRGLIHAYWAPNVWALWTFADRCLVKLLPRLPVLRSMLPTSFVAKFDKAAPSGFASASRGLVENIAFGVLPQITPSTCFLLTLTCMAVYMVKLWQTPTYRSLLAAVSMCGLASFLFGWHVHEKAIMLPLIPYTFLAAHDYAHLRTFSILTTAGVVSLFPLLFTPQEAPIKLVYSMLWAMLVFGILSSRVFRPVQGNVGLLVHRLESLYLAGFVVLQVYVSVVHPMMFASVHGGPTAVVGKGASSTRMNVTSSANAKVWVAEAGNVDAAEPTRAASAMPAPPAVAAESVPPSQSILASTVLPTARAEVDGASADAQVAFSTDEYDSPRPSSQPTAKGDADLLAVPVTPDVLTNAHGHGHGHSIDPKPEDIKDTQETISTVATASAMEFLPLMMVSVYCSVGVIWAWMRASAVYLLSDN